VKKHEILLRNELWGQCRQELVFSSPSFSTFWGGGIDVILWELLSTGMGEGIKLLLFVIEMTSMSEPGWVWYLIVKRVLRKVLYPIVLI